jgi:small-conductance mechanosensitive channel
VHLSDDVVRALITAAAWLVVFFVLRALLRRAFARWTRRLESRDPDEALRQRTVLSVLERVALAVVVAIAAWSVLSIFPKTEELARAVLASGAVIAIVASVALAGPLGNLGAGLLVAFTQPVRLGDRVTVGDVTGSVAEINLIYTVLVSDEDRRIFVPNTQLTSNAIVNRTINDPRRTLTASVPVRLTAPLEEARAAVLGELSSLADAQRIELRLTFGDVTEKLVWLTVTALAPPGVDAPALASALRERALKALREADLLPA